MTSHWRSVFFVLIAAADVIVVSRFAFAASPTVSGVTVSTVTATSTTLTWTTDMKTDSFIEFAQDTNYCGVRNSGDYDTQHSVQLLNLDPITTYYFRVRATDDNGNQSFSGDYTFTTTSSIAVPALNKVTNPQQQTLAAKAVSAIQQITNSQALNAVAQALQTQAASTVTAPKILGNPQVAVGTDQVTVTWDTDTDADGTVYVAPDAGYNSSSANPYPREEVDPNTSTMTHSVVVAGLTPATEYHYMVSSKGPLGDAGKSGDLTFTTSAVLPTILNPHLVKVGEHDAIIGWGTPFPTAGLVTYTNLSARKALSVGYPSLLVTHTVQLTDLVFQTRYSVTITAQNQAGDSVTSQPLYFVTTKNIIPPIISQVSNDSTLYPGQDTTVQTIVSWQTDEPASCNLSYSTGLVKNASDISSTTPETGFITKHVSVITNFTPATVYKYWVNCTDIDGNSTSSEDFVLLTPEQQKSIIDIILENFQGTFGWLNGGKKK